MVFKYCNGNVSNFFYISNFCYISIERLFIETCLVNFGEGFLERLFCGIGKVIFQRNRKEGENTDEQRKKFFVFSVFYTVYTYITTLVAASLDR